MRDAALEDGFARHDAVAYDAAYRAFGAQMQATALRLLRDREQARECVQDVFLHLWRHPAGYVSARGSLEAFLVTCARNAALTKIRSGSRQKKMIDALEPPQEYFLETDPIERERISHALSQLTEGQASVIERAYYRGMTLAEVAVELSIPIGTVKGRLSAALRALRQSLIPEASSGT